MSERNASRRGSVSDSQGSDHHVAPGPAVTAPHRLGAVVLVVDDDQRVRHVTAQLLARHGYDVRVAAGGREAVQIVGRGKSDVAAVLLDLNMPDLSGEETLRELRRSHPDLPVLVSSGNGEVDVPGHIVWDARTAFIQKPYRAADLYAALARLLGPTRPDGSSSP